MIATQSKLNMFSLMISKYFLISSPKMFLYLSKMFIFFFFFFFPQPQPSQIPINQRDVNISSFDRSNYLDDCRFFARPGPKRRVVSRAQNFVHSRASAWSLRFFLAVIAYTHNHRI